MIRNAQENRITCGEYLADQRRELAGIGDLKAQGALEKAEQCLCNIYAVSYQMHFERIEPPSRHRGPAENEPLDRQLIGEMSGGLKDKAHAFRDIMKDPGKLGKAMETAQQGNGFPLIQMVNEEFMAKRAQADQSVHASQAPQAGNSPAGPAL